MPRNQLKPHCREYIEQVLRAARTWKHGLLHGALFVMVWGLLHGVPAAQAAWDDGRALGNPCANWLEDLRTRRSVTPDERRIHGRPFLYNGVDKLAAPMPNPLNLSSEFAGERKSSCIVVEVVFGERNGELAVVRATPGLVYPPMRSDLLAVSWKRFFRENRCTSATMEQMRENMLRAANGQPSLQAAGIRVRNADSETEPLVPPRDKATIFDACYENHEYKDIDFCLCMDTRARKVMHRDELKKYSADFSLYYSEIVFPRKSGLQDPRWRLYELLKQCSGA